MKNQKINLKNKNKSSKDLKLSKLSKSLEAIAQDVIQQEINALIQLSSSINDNFTKVANIIVKISNKKGKIIISGMGKSGYIAKRIAALLLSIGIPSFFLHPAEAGHGDLGMICDNDIILLLSNSGESIELKNIINYCKYIEVPIIGITSKLNSTLHNASNINILIPNVPEASDIDIPTTSSIMMMAFGDALTIAIQKSINFTKEDYKKYHPKGKIGMKLYKASELMHVGNDIPIINKSAKAFDAIIEMNIKRLGCVVVVGDIQTNGANDNNYVKKMAHGTKQILGIITDGDLRRHISLDIRKYTAFDLMTKNPITVKKDMFISDVIVIMRNSKITQLIIEEDKKPIGIIHIHDLIKIGL